MSSAIDTWLSALLVALFGALLLLRVYFPKASRRSETAVLVSVTILFFGICNMMMPLRKSTARVALGAEAGIRTVVSR